MDFMDYQDQIYKIEEKLLTFQKSASSTYSNYKNLAQQLNTHQFCPSIKPLLEKNNATKQIEGTTCFLYP